MNMKTLPNFSALVQAYFTERLMEQRNASANTIASHRDAFRLLLGFAQQTLKKSPVELAMTDLDAPFIGRFLEHLEKDRGNTPRSRNIRLGAIHSFFKYIALQEPSLNALAQRVLAIPSKRHKTKPVDFLTRIECDALLAAANQDTWTGRRDRTLLLVAVQTGLRVSELIGLRCQDVVFGTGAHVCCTGKRRKQRCTPLRRDTITALRLWLHERNGQPAEALFPNARGHPLSRDGVEYLLAKYVTIARLHCPTLKNKRVSPHVLRHSVAMDLLQHGVDRSVIALWLGHESMETTQVYLHANMELKEQALAKIEPYSRRPGRFRPSDRLIAFLESLSDHAESESAKTCHALGNQEIKGVHSA
jgi:site-specific recombinase XerD